ncbi:MAG: glycosyltransferase family 4 protein [Verrucomicrobiae bacterium]|nr:glycosyltransferase family 4 protein [Verrucomicrobiae bacterium]NNJ44009.1 glycosyltransferase family 4 protein [Akkermansiaceae bacterium]
MKVAIHFARFGPYHLARISAAAEVLGSEGWNVVGLETGGADETYAWNEEFGEQRWERMTVFPGEAAERLDKSRVRAGMMQSLDNLKPDAVAIAGWGSVDARACLDWCKKNHAQAIVMSETREADGVRVWWKEWIKSRIIGKFDSALVGAASHRDYLVKLGMPAEKIQLGYNVVDNEYFAEECLKVGRSEVGGRRSEVEGLKVGKYFLASNRFIDRKNLTRLIEAYAQFSLNQLRTRNQDLRPPWNLCLLGDGELKSQLIKQCENLGLKVLECAPWEELPKSAISHQPSVTVYFPSFRQIEELPRFYAHAGCFVHPALEEPWGLVLNEAMACGLPVLSGSNVGAAEELIDEGVNGWTFNAVDVDEVAECLNKIVGMSEVEWLNMSKQSLRILEERCPTRAFGEGLVALLRDS